MEGGGAVAFEPQSTRRTQLSTVAQRFLQDRRPRATAPHPSPQPVSSAGPCHILALPDPRRAGRVGS